MTHYVQPTRRSNGNVVVPAHVAHLQSATMDGGMYPHYAPTSEPYGVAPPTMMVDDYGQANPYMQAQHDPHTVFVPLPQAPRLPAAAARASALATMYYDPTTMFPPHMLGHGASDPWSQSIAPGGAFNHDYSSNPYAEAAAPPQYGHADPMNSHGGHNQSFATQQIHPSSNVGLRTRSLAADPYVSRQHQAGAFGVQGRGSVPAPTYHSTQEQGNGAWAPSRWTGAAHFVDGSQAPVAHRHSYAATAPGDHAGYGHGAMHGHHQNPDLTAANAVQQHNAGWQYRFNADMRRHWEAQQQINSAAQPAQPQQPPMMYSQPTMADARPFGETRIAMDHDRMQQAWQWNNAAVQPSSMVQQQNAAKWQSRHAVPDNNANGDKNAFWQAQQAAQQHQVHHHDMAQRAAMDNVVSVADKGPAAEPIPPQKNAGPAPPSPGTLDKSAVPISSVGAEIVWIAAAALLDPTLWLPNKEEAAATSIQRKRMASHGSSSDVSASTLHTPMTSPVNGFQEEWQRQPTYARRNVGELLEESSASSSEPGTPPSTVPSRIWEQQHGEGNDAKRISLSALRGMRSLGLSGQEDNAGPRASMDRGSASPREMQSPRSRSFRRLESFDRSRETVASVADLLSWDCRWSANDEKLDSLRHSRSIGGVVVQQPGGQAAVAPAMTRRTSSQNRMCREDPNSTVSTGLAMSSTEASPAFRRFTHQVLAQTLVSPTAFMLGIMYALRVLRLAIVVDQNGEACVDPEAVEIFAQPPSAAPFKLFTLGMMIANKHLDDNTFLNKTWNEVTGIALPEINRAERWYLERCSYEITVPEVTWIAFLRRLHERTEQRVNILTAAKRYRVSTVKQAPDAPRRHDQQYVPSHAGNEEAQKRFLLCIEEALQNLGYAPQFSLSNASSPLQQRDAALPLHTEQSQRLSRPKKSLTHMHQHCHSAPAVGLDEDSDIFDDEDGPYRPYRRSATNRTTTAASNAASNVPLRNSIANESGLLSRSYSDSVPVIAPSSCAAQEHHRARKAADAMQLVADGNAPLAPSVLLELLNKGQHLAHVAS